MTQKTEKSWQKLPLGERILDPLLTLFWVALIPSYYCGFIALERNLLPIEYYYNSAWDFFLMIPVTLIIWKETFWRVCHKAPKMYPVNFLIHTYGTKRTWLKPPACFYTEEFQEVFKNSWIPYFAQNPSVSHERTGTFSPNQFDFSTDSGTDISNFSHPVNPANPLNPLHSFNTANPDNFAHNSFNNDNFSSSHDSSFPSSLNF